MPEKELSIFLSGTRRDLPGFWPAAKQALADAFPDIEIRIMEDAEPEDIPGDHWSRREASRPDALLGLVGRYYGTIPRGQTRSLTEQEFDVAGQVAIERMMFLTEARSSERSHIPDPRPSGAGCLSKSDHRRRQTGTCWR